MAGPCSWPVSYAACSPSASFTALSAEDKATFEAMAGDFLWLWTRRQFGVCRMALRPCRTTCESWSTFEGLGPVTTGSSSPRGFAGPALVNGEWYNFRCGRCPVDLCTCGAPVALALPGPAMAVYEVLVDGVALAPSAYRLSGDQLVRADGQPWPTCQDLLALPSTKGTWQVTYDRGTPVPVGGQIAAGMLAMELAKAACRDSTCQLPQRIQTITRQGVTIGMLDPFDGLEKGFTGIWLIDSWITSITKPQLGGRVYSPDVPLTRGRATRA